MLLPCGELYSLNPLPSNPFLILSCAALYLYQLASLPLIAGGAFTLQLTIMYCLQMVAVTGKPMGCLAC